jgi:hypothetical protein
VPKFTIDLSQNTVDKLQAQVQRTNENTGSSLTLQQWMTLHLRELAITDELTAAVTAIRDQQQQDAQTALEAAVRAKRDELLAEL